MQVVAGSNPVTPTGQEAIHNGWLPSFLPVKALFYILHSATLDRYYIGHTGESMEERLRKHLADHTHWTARAKDWRVVHTEPFPDKASAYRREREVKAWKKRQRIEDLFRTP